MLKKVMETLILKNCLTISKGLYDFINNVVKLKYKYSELCNDLIIIIGLFYEIKNSRRLEINNPNINQTIKLIEENLVTLDKKLRKNLNLKNKIFKTLTKDINDKKYQLNLLIKRLKLLLEINKQKVRNSRLDIVNILKDEELIFFWEKNFGSEQNKIDYDILIQSLEDEISIKLRNQEKDILKNIIDIDRNNIISVYEFNIWIKRFGPIKNAIRNTLISLYDPKIDNLYEWYFGDMFFEKVKEFLEDKGFGTTIIRNNFIQINNFENTVFFLTFVGWSFQNDNIEIFEIPIKKIHNKYQLDIENIIKFTDCGTEFIKHFNFSIENRELIYDDLITLYLDFQNILRKFAHIFNLIYYSHFEKSSYYNTILGEVINIYNKCSSKIKKLRGIDYENKTSHWNFCSGR